MLFAFSLTLQARLTSLDPLLKLLLDLLLFNKPLDIEVAVDLLNVTGLVLDVA